MARIVIIGSTQLSLNPRLVKEADALSEAGFEVTVLYQYWHSWGAAMDRKLIPKKRWTAVMIGGAPDSDRLLYWYSRVAYKIGVLLAAHVRLTPFIAGLVAGRANWLLVKSALAIRADLYIAHTLAALPAAVKASQKYGAPCGFDAEDFHRHETSDDAKNLDVRKKIFLEETYFPPVGYFTAASPDIALAYERVFPKRKFNVVLNVFPKRSGTATPGMIPLKTLRLVWFSQTVGMGRGLQDVFSALKLLENLPVEFHILGYLPGRLETALQDFLHTLNFGGKPAVYFHPPMPPDDIPLFLSAFDIGMATEPGVPMNNDLLLSNKMLTYITAGVAIIATNTSGQRRFLGNYPACGVIYQQGDVVTLSNLILNYFYDRAALNAARNAAFTLGREHLNWEIEAPKIVGLARQALNIANT